MLVSVSALGGGYGLIIWMLVSAFPVVAFSRGRAAIY